MALQPGNAAQLAERLRALADYGESKKAPADSALAQGVADARAYADYLDGELARELAGVLIVPGSSVYETADALAQLITDEGPNYGGDAPPAEKGAGPNWALLLGGAAAAGVLAYCWRRGML